MASSVGPDRLAAAEADLASRDTIPAILRALSRHLVDVLGGSACVVSRIVGDMLVQLVEVTRPNINLKQLGHGYLIADYPLTQEVLEQAEARTVAADDPEADQAEVRLLGELGFDRLLMMPLPVDGHPWALVEVYGSGSLSLDETNTSAATLLVGAAGAAIERTGVG